MFIGFEQVAVSTSVLDVNDLTIPANATSALLQADTSSIRFTMDGSTNPSTTSGMLLINGAQPKEFLINDIRNIKFRRDGSTDGNLNVHYAAGRDV